MTRIGRSPWTAVLVLVLVANVSTHAQPQANTGTIRGVIVDARDGTPLEKVSIRVQTTKQATLSASDGTFQLDEVPVGRHELYVSSVDYVLIRRTIDVSAGALVEIAIPISAGTGTYTETVNVTSAGAEDDGGGTLEVLRSNELQQLRGVITNDPMRAIHVLPGVATGDDLRSEFSVRGLPVGNMNFTFEGIATRRCAAGDRAGGRIVSAALWRSHRRRVAFPDARRLTRASQRTFSPEHHRHVVRSRRPAGTIEEWIVAHLRAQELSGEHHQEDRP